MSTLIFDIEANGFLMDATVVHCIVLQDDQTGEVFKYGPDEIMLAISHLMTADTIVGHNVSLYDLPLLQRLYDIQWEDLHIVDTMLLSRLSSPDRFGGHSLEALGKALGFPKSEHTDFTTYSPEMLAYCVQDVAVTRKVYHSLLAEASQFQEAVELEHKFAFIISQQILNGFCLDVDYTSKLLTKLKDEYDELYTQLTRILPRKRIESHYNSVKQGGRLLDASEGGYRYLTPQTQVVKEAEWKYEDPNPRSRQQIISFFQERYGWVPEKETDKGNPIIDEAVLETLPYDEAVAFSRLFRLNKQIAMISDESGWLSFVRDGRVHGSVITNGAVTGRCTHSKPNMAQIDAKDPRMRQCWIAKEGWDLISMDADQLEVRALAHFTHPHDNGDLKLTILEGDLHSQNQEFCGFENRKTAKTALYAFIYGAGNEKLGKIESSEEPSRVFGKGTLIQKGKRVRENLNRSMYGLIELVKRINLALGERGFLYGLDGRKLFIRSQHAALNTLLQSAGAVVMKMCLVEFWKLMREAGYVHGVDFGLVANVHDEIVLEARPEISEKIKKIIDNAISNVVVYKKIKCPLTMGFAKGHNWSEIH